MFTHRAACHLQLQLLKDPTNQLSIIRYHGPPMGPLVHPQTVPARTHATSQRQCPELAPKSARSAHGPLRSGRTDDGIDGRTYDNPRWYVDMMEGDGVVPLL